MTFQIHVPLTNLKPHSNPSRNWTWKLEIPRLCERSAASEGHGYSAVHGQHYIRGTEIFLQLGYLLSELKTFTFWKVRIFQVSGLSTVVLVDVSLCNFTVFFSALVFTH